MKVNEKVNKQLFQIAQRISKARQLKGYKPEIMAIELNISRAAYYNIESGKTKITLQRLCQIAEILEVSLLSLIEDEKKRRKRIVSLVINIKKVKFFINASKSCWKKILN